MCCSAVNDGSCSPWVMCSCSVVRGNQIRDNIADVFLLNHLTKNDTFPMICIPFKIAFHRQDLSFQTEQQETY